jgi:hypothetical protein
MRVKLLPIPTPFSRPIGDRRKFGGASARGVFSRLLSDQGGRVAWIVRLVNIGADGEEPFADVMTINRPDDLDDIANLGLTVADGKRLLANLQQEIVAAQARIHAVRRPWRLSCERLPKPCSGDAFWPGHGAASSLSLCWMWRRRSWP